MRTMLERQEDVFFYLTLMNENYAQPSMPPGVEDGIVRGLYRLQSASEGLESASATRSVPRLIGSGAILPEVIAAASLLRDTWSVPVEVWSCTSFGEVARDARDAQRWNRLHPEQAPRLSHLEQCLGAGSGPIIAVSDYVRAYPQLIAEYVASEYVTLGTDGFGRSDTRRELRNFFEVDRHHIVIATLAALARSGAVPASQVARAISEYGLDVESAPSWER